MLNMFDDIFKRITLLIVLIGFLLVFLSGFIGYCIGTYVVNKQQEKIESNETYVRSRQELLDVIRQYEELNND